MQDISFKGMDFGFHQFVKVTLDGEQDGWLVIGESLTKWDKLTRYWIYCLLWQLQRKLVISETRLGDFWKLLVTNFLIKVLQLWLKGIFQTTMLLSKNSCSYLSGSFWKLLDYFLFQHLVTLLVMLSWSKGDFINCR